MFAQHYNKTRFGNDLSNAPGVLDHVHSAVHQDNKILYMNKLNSFSTVMARITMSLELLSQIVTVCEQAGREDGFDSMWYLSTAEESRSMIASLNKAQSDLINAGAMWSRRPSHGYMWEVLHAVSNLPQLTESFYIRKNEEERTMKQRRLDEMDSIEADGVVENPIQELMCGPYLNPDAPAFVPTFDSII